MNKKKDDYADIRSKIIWDNLYEYYEIMNGESLKQDKIIELLELPDKTALSKIRNGKRELNVKQIKKLAIFFNVPTDVIMGMMDISEIPTKDKYGLKELSFKWIDDNSKNEHGIERVKMLNRVLSSPKAANLLFDTLCAYTANIPIRVMSLDERFNNSDLKRILYKELILTSLDEFFVDMYKRGEADREARTEEQVNEILNRLQESRQILKQQHDEEDKIALQELEEELKDGLEEMLEDNRQ